MESGGIESSAAAAAERAPVVVSMDDIGSTLLSLDAAAVHLQKMKLLMAENENVSVDKVLAPNIASPPQNQCNNNNNNNSGEPAAAPATAEILQIVELSDLLLLDDNQSRERDRDVQRTFGKSMPISDSKNNSVGGGDNNNYGHGQLIDFRAEKCDVTPENLKKSDHDEAVSGSSLLLDEDSLLIDLRSVGVSGSFSGNAMQFCDTTKAKGDCDAADTACSVQLTLLDLDDPPPVQAVVPDKPQAFTISFGEGERSEEQKQKYEKMFERFQNKRSHQQHRRGQSLSKVDVVDLSKSASGQDTPSAGQATTTTTSTTTSNSKATGPNRLTKTPSSAKLPRKTFSEPSSKVCNVCNSICRDYF